MKDELRIAYARVTTANPNIDLTNAGGGLSSMSDVTERLTPSARKLLDHAYREALSLGKNAIEADHIALALARDVKHDHRRLCDAFDLHPKARHNHRGALMTEQRLVSTLSLIVIAAGVGLLGLILFDLTSPVIAALHHAGR